MAGYGVVLDFDTNKVLIVKFCSKMKEADKEERLAELLPSFPNNCQWMFLTPKAKVEIETMEV